jgi:hypothetical protein
MKCAYRIPDIPWYNRCVNVALQRLWTTEQILVWESRQELRYPFDGVRPIAVAGGIAVHGSIRHNVPAASACEANPASRMLDS